MQEDIVNYSPTVMFRGTPCISSSYLFGQSFQGDCCELGIVIFSFYLTLKIL